VTAVLVVGVALLGVAGLLLVVRMTAGPTVLDRVVALEALVSVLICGLALEAAVNQHSYTVPALVGLSLLGFIGSVSVASTTRGSELAEGDDE
jgi:multicomponent Na+:H+ antiporter subunit F